MDGYLCSLCHEWNPMRFQWQALEDGRRAIRQTCARCGRFLRWAPQMSPFIALANAAPIYDPDAPPPAGDRQVPLFGGKP